MLNPKNWLAGGERRYEFTAANTLHLSSDVRASTNPSNPLHREHRNPRAFPVVWLWSRHGLIKTVPHSAHFAPCDPRRAKICGSVRPCFMRLPTNCISSRPFLSQKRPVASRCALPHDGFNVSLANEDFASPLDLWQHNAQVQGQPALQRLRLHADLHGPRAQRCGLFDQAATRSLRSRNSRMAMRPSCERVRSSLLAIASSRRSVSGSSLTLSWSFFSVLRGLLIASHMYSNDRIVSMGKCKYF